MSSEWLCTGWDKDCKGKKGLETSSIIDRGNQEYWCPYCASTVEWLSPQEWYYRFLDEDLEQLN